MKPTGAENAYRIVDEYCVDEEQLSKFSENEQSQQNYEEDFDRNELLSQITRFYDQGDNRAKFILNFMLE